MREHLDAAHFAWQRFMATGASVDLELLRGLRLPGESGLAVCQQLGIGLAERYSRTHDGADLDRAIAIVSEAHRSPGLSADEQALF
jgi:hypothetical protein